MVIKNKRKEEKQSNRVISFNFRTYFLDDFPLYVEFSGPSENDTMMNEMLLLKSICRKTKHP